MWRLQDCLSVNLREFIKLGCMPLTQKWEEITSVWWYALIDSLDRDPFRRTKRLRQTRALLSGLHFLLNAVLWLLLKVAVEDVLRPDVMSAYATNVTGLQRI